MAVALSFVVMSHEYVVARPFPFVDVHYVTEEDVFDSPAMGEAANYLAIPGLSHELKQKAETILEKHGGINSGNPQQSARTICTAARSIQSASVGSQYRTLDDILSESDQFISICSEYSKIVCVLAQAAGLPARVLWMNRHTVAEVFFPNNGWALLDAYGNLAFIGKNGRLLSELEYRKAPDNATISRLDTSSYNRNMPDFTPDFDHVAPVFAHNTLYFVLSGDSLFAYPKNHRNPDRIMKSILNIEDLGRGVQYVDKGSVLPKIGNVGLDFHRHFQAGS